MQAAKWHLLHGINAITSVATSCIMISTMQSIFKSGTLSEGDTLYPIVE